MKNIGITGGGTGGHITPLIALLQYGHKHRDLSKNCNHIYRFGEANSYEQDACEQLGYDRVSFVPLSAGKLRRYWTLESTWRNIRDLFRVIRGFFQAVWWIKQKKIDVLFCKGGYVILPVAIAAWCWKVPVLVHESDMHAGLANRLVAKFATHIYTGFPGTFAHENVVGQLLSPSFVEEDNVTTLPEIDADKTSLLVICASQGSSTVMQALLSVFDRNVRTVKEIDRWMIGGKKNPEFREKFAKYSDIHFFDFLSSSELSVVYQGVDLAITRGSATTLAELDMFGVKKAIIPLPFTGGNHQELNADWYQANKDDTKILQTEQLSIDLEARLEAHIAYRKLPKTPASDEYFNAHETILSDILA